MVAASCSGGRIVAWGFDELRAAQKRLAGNYRKRLGEVQGDTPEVRCLLPIEVIVAVDGAEEPGEDAAEYAVYVHRT